MRSGGLSERPTPVRRAPEERPVRVPLRAMSLKAQSGPEVEQAHRAMGRPGLAARMLDPLGLWSFGRLARTRPEGRGANRHAWRFDRSRRPRRTLALEAARGGAARRARPAAATARLSTMVVLGHRAEPVPAQRAPGCASPRLGTGRADRTRADRVGWSLGGHPACAGLRKPGHAWRQESLLTGHAGRSPLRSKVRRQCVLGNRATTAEAANPRPHAKAGNFEPLRGR